jgi:AcrR family transcriptional regulator
MSRSSEKITARVPQRERGKRRVAALLRAAVSLFAEKGYDAVTMTEVAARAGSPIGSLYQFFPSKEALADAVLDHFGERLHDALKAIEAEAAGLAIPALADALLGVLVGFQEERAAVAALIESRQDASARAAELRSSLRRHIAQILRVRIPRVSPRDAESMAVVIVQLMKAAATISVKENLAIRDAVLDELRQVTQLYLTDRAAQPSKGLVRPQG